MSLPAVPPVQRQRRLVSPHFDEFAVVACGRIVQVERCFAANSCHMAMAARPEFSVEQPCIDEQAVRSYDWNHLQGLSAYSDVRLHGRKGPALA